MSPTVRKFLAPRWIAGHLLVLAICVTMILLGRWQLMVSNRKHFDLQNSAYAVQWWLFTGFALWGYQRIMRDGLRLGPESAAAVSLPLVGQPDLTADAAPAVADSAAPSARPRRAAAFPVTYSMPQSDEISDDALDPIRADYNRYLAALAEPADAGDHSGRPSS